MEYFPFQFLQNYYQYGTGTNSRSEPHIAVCRCAAADLPNASYSFWTSMSNEFGGGLPTDLLPGSVPRLLNRDPSSPFESDLDYFDAIVACESARKRAFNLSVASRAVFKPSSDEYARPESTFFENGRDLRRTFEDLVGKLERKVQQILDRHNETRPIVEIFLDAMDASDEERKLFRCVLVAASGALREMDTQDFQIPI